MNTYVIHFKVCENIFGEGYKGKLLAQANSMQEGIIIIKEHVLNTINGVIENAEFIFIGGYQTN